MKNNKFNSEHLQNIKKVFEEKTGVQLSNTEPVSKEQHRKRLFLRSTVALATTAAVVCLAVFGNILLKPQDSNESLQNNNIFSVKAYAMEQQSDGTMELREVDLINHPDIPSGYLDGENFYLNVGLKCEGENIKSVEFSTDDGFFAKQHGEFVTKSVPTLYKGEADIPVYGNDFEKVGKKLTLDKDTLTDDFLLFLGIENVGIKNVPKKITIYALATFNDGKTQEEIIALDYSDVEMAIGVGFNEEDIKKWERDYVDTLKVEEIFIAQMKDKGFKEVRVNNIEFHDWVGKSIWRISFDAISKTDWVTNQTLYVSVSIPPDDEYILTILGTNP